MDNLVDCSDNKRVLVGLSGGRASFVAAYLLKIQKFEVIAATIVQRVNSETKCSVSEQDLLNIQDFCRRLNIPHHVIEDDEAFREKVQNTWISKRIEARPWSSLCLSCHEFRLDLLFQKMNTVKANFLSTGHFAKIFKGEDGQSIHSVHDLHIDQSHILQHIPSSILAHLILPLASLGSSEIEKLASNFSLNMSAPPSLSCFTGEVSLNALDSVLPIMPEDLPLENHSLRKNVKLIDVKWSGELPLLRPFSGFLNTSDGATHKVNVFPKTLKSVELELTSEIEFSQFTHLAVYKKKGGNSKLILSGIILFEESKNPTEDLEFVF